MYQRKWFWVFNTTWSHHHFQRPKDRNHMSTGRIERSVFVFERSQAEVRPLRFVWAGTVTVLGGSSSRTRRRYQLLPSVRVAQLWRESSKNECREWIHLRALSWHRQKIPPCFELSSSELFRSLDVLRVRSCLRPVGISKAWTYETSADLCETCWVPLPLPHILEVGGRDNERRLEDT